PHNQAVAVWLDNGLFGLFLFVAGLICLVRESYRANPFLLAGCVPLVAEVGFSHNLLENKSYLFSWLMFTGLAWHARRRKVSVASMRPVSIPRLKPMPTENS